MIYMRPSFNLWSVLSHANAEYYQLLYYVAISLKSYDKYHKVNLLHAAPIQHVIHCQTRGLHVAANMVMCQLRLSWRWWSPIQTMLMMIIFMTIFMMSLIRLMSNFMMILRRGLQGACKDAKVIMSVDPVSCAGFHHVDHHHHVQAHCFN